MNPLIQRLLQPEAYPHPTGTIALRETHSAWVLLTGPYAYKLRKPVNFGFLDYSTAEKRRFCAQEELRLNRRLAPDLYLDLVELQGPPQQARFGGSEPGIELAVRMRQFDDQQLLSRAVEHGEISPDAIEALADELARFQSAAAVAPANGAWGTPAAVVAPVQSNLSALANAKALQSELAELQEWVNQSTKNLEPFFWQRLRSGRIREGHGDLHLGNMFLENGRIRVFDCLEFNPDLRWVDTISEMAFLVMDLESRGHESLALHLLNHWLDLVGDWQGLVAWRWYSAYRALVRAKVAELRRAQAQAEAPSDPAGSTQAREERDRYIAQALSWCRPHRQAVLITCGLSGSGKSWMSGQIAGAIGALRLRSDVERKRLFGLWGEPRRASRSGDLYRREVSDELFGRILPEQAKAVLAGGFSALIDATFLRQAERRVMAELAAQHNVPLVILACHCPADLARDRIGRRRRSGSDPSDADAQVLQQQMQWLEPISAAERAEATVIDLNPDSRADQLAAQLKQRIQQR